MIIGVTGLFGSGKTLVSRMFAEHGYKHVDADKVYGELLDTRPELLEELRAEFSEAVKDKVDRNKLKKIVFGDKEKLKRLNEITHPVVIEEIRRLVSSGNVVLDVPLLVEANAVDMVDKVVVVICDDEARIKRLLEKGYSREQIRQITASQLDEKEKIKYADYVVDNSGSVGKTREQVEKIIREA